METEVIYDDGLAYSPNSAQEFIWHIEVNMARSSSRGAYDGNSILVKSTAWEGKIHEDIKTDDSHQALVTVPEVIQP